MTGFDNDWRRGVGAHFHFDPKRHDAGRKRIFGRAGDYDWQDAVRLCLRHPLYPSFFVDKLWGYFVPTAPDRATRRSLERLYRDGHQIRPVLEAILRHRPATGRAWSSRPSSTRQGCCMRWAAGSTRTRGPGSPSQSGQRLFLPPNVAGWDDARGLDTATFRGRWSVANYRVHPYSLNDKQAASLPAEPQALVDGAIAFWGCSTLRPATKRRCSRSRAGRWATP